MANMASMTASVASVFTKGLDGQAYMLAVLDRHEAKLKAAGAGGKKMREHFSDMFYLSVLEAH